MLREKWRTFSLEFKCQASISDYAITLGMLRLTLITGTGQQVSGVSRVQALSELQGPICYPMITDRLFQRTN